MKPKSAMRYYTEQEDKILRQLVSTKTAEELAIILGRTKASVKHRTRRLGLSARKSGDAHWKSNVSDLQAQMGACLLEHYTPTEIHRATGISYHVLRHIQSGARLT